MNRLSRNHHVARRLSARNCFASRAGTGHVKPRRATAACNSGYVEFCAADLPTLFMRSLRPETSPSRRGRFRVSRPRPYALRARTAQDDQQSGGSVLNVDEASRGPTTRTRSRPLAPPSTPISRSCRQQHERHVLPPPTRGPCNRDPLADLAPPPLGCDYTNRVSPAQRDPLSGVDCCGITFTGFHGTSSRRLCLDSALRCSSRSRGMGWLLQHKRSGN